MRVGILGTGGIEHVLADTFSQMEEVECYAVASRTLEKAEKFCEETEFKQAYGSYLELVEDPKVELVYIATPHSNHYDDMRLCIEHHKPVLCEKAFTMNATQARKIKDLAIKNRVYVAEAIWTRYMPSRKMINDVLESGKIGNVTTLTANLSYPIHQKYRITAPELAGGALLDVGVYGLNFAFMHFGTYIEKMESSVQRTSTGVDGQETITIFFKGGKMANLTHGIYSRSDRKGVFYGDKGYMVVENINNPQKISIYDLNDQLVEEMLVPEQISGYEYQVREAISRIKAGEMESASMPLWDSVFVMEIMDSLRKQWGIVYPQER